LFANFRRGLHPYVGAGAKTGLAACLIELKHQNLKNVKIADFETFAIV
jgi:hypothetical protein